MFFPQVNTKLQIFLLQIFASWKILEIWKKNFFSISRPTQSLESTFSSEDNRWRAWSSEDWWISSENNRWRAWSSEDWSLLQRGPSLLKFSARTKSLQIIYQRQDNQRLCSTGCTFKCNVSFKYLVCHHPHHPPGILWVKCGWQLLLQGEVYIVRGVPRVGNGPNHAISFNKWHENVVHCISRRLGCERSRVQCQ